MRRLGKLDELRATLEESRAESRRLEKDKEGKCLNSAYPRRLETRGGERLNMDEFEAVLEETSAGAGRLDRASGGQGPKLD